MHVDSVNWVIIIRRVKNQEKITSKKATTVGTVSLVYEKILLIGTGTSETMCSHAQITPWLMLLFKIMPP